jgi:uncharacterized RDD family membrane protein YckC
MTEKNLPSAGIIRRLAAMLYDTMLLVAVLFVATAVAVAINKGEAVTHPIYYLSLLLISYGFFGWFWTHGGQTLGMRTWRLKLEADSGQEIDWPMAGKRFVFAAISLLPFGAGLFWQLFDPEGKAVHDRLSESRVVFIPKELSLPGDDP